MSKLTAALLVAAGLLVAGCQTTSNGNTAGADRDRATSGAENGWAGTHRYDKGL